MTTATTVHHLSAGRLAREVWLPLAPSGEREGIAQTLLNLESRTDGEVISLHKLRAQKLGLTNDLLTGRIRVTPLPESVQQAAAQIVQQPVGQTEA